MSENSSEKHKKIAGEGGPVALAVITVSDSRTEENDTNGNFLRSEIEKAGHELVFYQIIKDEPLQVAQALQDAVQQGSRVILFNGGTGIARRDTTYDALSRLLQKTLPGFGEIFRLLSYEQVGSAAMLSRAVAGIYQNRIVFSMPGSPKAVQLAWTRLIQPELHHLAWELTR